MCSQKWLYFVLIIASLGSLQASYTILLIDSSQIYSEDVASEICQTSPHLHPPPPIFSYLIGASAVRSEVVALLVCLWMLLGLCACVWCCSYCKFRNFREGFNSAKHAKFRENITLAKG